MFAKAADPTKPNCVDVGAKVAGMGVDKVGPIAVYDRGNGWLSADIVVTAEQTR
jgi:hypothetical protein